MKLYHASPIENKEDILEYGIYSNESEKISNDERLSGSYVFGFNNIADAINFITDNTSDYVIFSFEVPDYDVIQDTEYEDGCAFAVEYDITPDRLVLEKKYFKIYNHENKK